MYTHVLCMYLRITNQLVLANDVKSLSIVVIMSKSRVWNYEHHEYTHFKYKVDQEYYY